MNLWEKVKKDLQKEIEVGVTMAKEGVAVVRKKAGELTEEGKKQYKIFELKSKVRHWITELGGRVYELSSKVSNPLTDTTVKLMLVRIKKLESQIAKLEGKTKIVSKKTPRELTAISSKDSTPNNKRRK